MSGSVPVPEEDVTGEPFVSYSINFEDVVLRRLFAGRPTGFFVDVGAEHPIVGNDFYGLYTQGWRGINIEPNPSYFALLQEHRPLDTNLQLVLSDVAGEDLAYFEVENTGLSTCDESQVAACLAQGFVVRRHDVRSSTLKDILHAAGSPHVDILKVDVEGLEEKVLLGNDWEHHRPSIIMVEVTYPRTSTRRPTGIRASLEALGYRHIHFDNLNDFFAEAGFDVPPGATLPPNVFDRFVPRDVVALREDNVSIRANFQAAETYAHALEAEHAAFGTEREALLAERASLNDALSHAATTADALVRERTALQQQGAALNKVACQAQATATATLRLAIAAMLGRSDQVRTLLSAVPVPEQEEGRAMPEQGRELVTIAGEGVIDGDHPAGSSAHLPVEVRAELMAAQLRALDEQNSRLLDDIADLRHETRRLLASLRQAQGENLSLQRALGPSYAARDDMLRLHETIGALQVQVRQHHQVVTADFDARVQEAVSERIGEIADRGTPSGTTGWPEPTNEADTLLLNAMLASTSWRITRPLRVLRGLFGSAGR